MLCMSKLLSILFSKTYNSHLFFKTTCSSIVLSEMSKAYNDIKINIPFPESATFLIPLLFLEGAGETSGAYLVSRLVDDQIAAKMGALTGPQ